MLGLGFKKKKFLDTSKTISALLDMVTKKKTHFVVEKKISGEIMKDKDILFLLRSFSTKYKIHMNQLTITPVIIENTLLVEKWVFNAADQTILDADGLDKLTLLLIEVLLYRDDECEKLKFKIKRLLK